MTGCARRVTAPMSNTAKTTTEAGAAPQRTDARLTPARRAVLDILLAAPSALTHQEVARAALETGRALDRVTLYRVLDWLVEQGMAHKIAAEDRVWRFNAAPRDDANAPDGHAHAHFQCRVCGRLYCLDELRAAPVYSLPPGFTCEQAELTLRGVCANCT